MMLKISKSNIKPKIKNGNNKKEKYVLNIAEDLLKMPNDTFYKIDISSFSGEYYNKIYQEALEVEQGKRKLKNIKPITVDIEGKDNVDKFFESKTKGTKEKKDKKEMSGRKGSMTTRSKIKEKLDLKIKIDKKEKDEKKDDSYQTPNKGNKYQKIIKLNKKLKYDSPVNNKLKVFPYNYLLVTNNAGIDTIFHYEDFSSNTPVFKVIGDITPGCSIKCIPINYLKQTDNNSFKSFNYGIAGGKLPICAWSNDTYTNWLAENGVSMAVSGITSALEIGVGVAAIATGAGAVAGAGLIASGAGGIANTLMENHKASLMPDQANGNMSAGDITYSAGKSGFTAYKLSIRKERAKAIDDYFSMFGYKVNTLKVPELHSRSKWNYIKTIDINITAYIPQEDLQKIKEMFNNGITLWHDSAHFLDYSQSNPIVV